MKRIIKNALTVLFLFSIVTVFSQESTKNYTLNGQVQGGYKGYVYLSTKGRGAIKDSCLVVNNKFSFQGDLNKAVQASLTLNPVSTVVFFYLEQNPIALTIATSTFKNGNEVVNDLEIMKIEGSKTQEIMTEIDIYQKSIEKSNLTKQEKNDKIYKKYYESISGNPDYPIFDFLMVKSKKSGILSEDQIMELASLVKEDKEEQSVQDSLIIRNKPKIHKSLKEGKQLDNFTLPNVKGQQVSINSFKGKVTLIDFWASWYAPSRKNNKELVKIDKRYRGKNLQIVSVSIDTYSGNWIKAIEKDQLSWVNLIESGGWHGKVTEQFQIKGIPLNILLDKEGKILAVNVTGDALTKKLDHHLNVDSNN
jgi:peroxiredoxin